MTGTLQGRRLQDCGGRRGHPHACVRLRLRSCTVEVSLPLLEQRVMTAAPWQRHIATRNIECADDRAVAWGKFRVAAHQAPISSCRRVGAGARRVGVEYHTRLQA
eukprot:COSAG02_NODE_389_length_23251_cov_259.067640_3_plen_105_part_00